MAKAKKVDTSVSADSVISTEEPTTPEEDTQPNPYDRAESYQSEHFSVHFRDGKAAIAPLGWVGPAPLLVKEARLGELADLLQLANQK